MSTTAQTLERARQIEIDYIRDNLDYYVDTYVMIEDKDADEVIVPFKLWPAQQEALQSIHDNRLNIILKARQLGFTWLILAYVSWALLTHPGWLTIAFSRAETQAGELVRRLEVIYSHMSALIKPQGTVGWSGITYRKTTLALYLYFSNGMVSTFQAFPASGNASISFTANILMLDEWAEQEQADEIWAKAYPNINRPTGGKVIGLSTIERGTLFERLYTEDNNFNKIFVPWSADPRRTIEWYEQTRRDMGDEVMSQYPATVDEALTIPGGAYFPEVKPHSHLADPYYDTTGFRRYACLDYGLTDMLSVHWIWVDRGYNARVYREFDMSGLTISEACKKMLEHNQGDQIEAWLAPDDLWARSQESGKAKSTIFYENGIQLTKTTRNKESGCANLKEWLKVRKDGTAALMIDEGAAPNLFRCLTKIQKDKNNPNVYESKLNHDLTHDVDSLRCFAVYYTKPADPPKQPEKAFAFDVLKPKSNPGGYGERIRII